MTNTERKFVNLAMDYLIHAKDKDIYSYDRDEYAINKIGGVCYNRRKQSGEG